MCLFSWHKAQSQNAIAISFAEDGDYREVIILLQKAGSETSYSTQKVAKRGLKKANNSKWKKRPESESIV